jgi:hypothetical protein
MQAHRDGYIYIYIYVCTFWAIVWPGRGNLGPFRGHLGLALGHLGPSCGRLEAMLRHLHVAWNT